MLLRYPGGKAKIYPIVKNIIEQNNLFEKTYCEPFSGGFGLGLKLLLKGDVKKAIINDFDIHISSFWMSVFSHTKKLIDKIRTTEISINEWHIQKAIYNNPDEKKYSILDIGFSTLFLNRTNFSGILMSGPIGGYKQTGKYKMDCRFNKELIISQIQKIAKYKKNVKVYRLDAVRLLRKLKNIEQEIFYNFDPPYVKKGEELYMNFFEEKDHVKLKMEIEKVRAKWIMTYDNDKLIIDLYKKYKPKEFNLSYTVSSKRIEKELMISNLKVLKVASA